MSHSLDDLLRPNRIALQLIGLWPIAMDSHIRAFKRIRRFVTFVSLAAVVIPQIYSIGYAWGDILYVAETSTLMIPFLLLFLKFIYITWRRRDFARIHLDIQRFWLISDSVIERATYEIPARIGRFVTLLALVAIMFDYLAFIGWALISNHRRLSDSRRVLPVNVSYGFDYETATWPKTFNCLFAAQMFNIAYYAYVAIGCDTSVLVAVVHMIGQFRLINYRLRMIGEQIDAGFYSTAEVSAEKEIANCISHHQIVVGAANTLSNLISPMVFGQLIFSGLQICVCCFAILDGSAATAIILKFCVLLASLIVQLMMWYVPGDYLEKESSAVATSIFHQLPWYLMDKKSLRRDLLFVMLRAQKSCKIVALYQVTNIAKITEVIKAASSFLALFRSVKH